MFEVNTNEDIDPLDLSDYTQDKSPALAPSQNQRFHPLY